LPNDTMLDAAMSRTMFWQPLRAMAQLATVIFRVVANFIVILPVVVMLASDFL